MIGHILVIDSPFFRQFLPSFRFAQFPAIVKLRRMRENVQANAKLAQQERVQLSTMLS